MKRILLGIAAAISVAVIIVLGLALAQPDKFTLQREIAIAAQPPVIFANLEDFKRWEAWSPWEKLEPTMSKVYSGPASGVGSSYAWEGKEVGSGKMTITESRPSQHLAIRLEFIKPFEATNTTLFELSPRGADTQVKWIMTGDNSLFGKVMGVFADMDAMVGKDFETGLSALKRVSESPSP
jgi:hypothetical protein